jgi:hypothetical protein
MMAHWLFNKVIADRQQFPTARRIERGVRRMLAWYGLASVSELPLGNGRFADVVGLSQAGEIWIVEIKSSRSDFRADRKWPEYRDYSDRLFFAVAPGFPLQILPEDTGIIVADRYSGEAVRVAPLHRLTSARRKAMVLRFARSAAFQLQAIKDPAMRLEAPGRD